MDVADMGEEDRISLFTAPYMIETFSLLAVTLNWLLLMNLPKSQSNVTQVNLQICICKHACETL